MSELLKETEPKNTTANGREAGISAVDAVRLVVNTAVTMSEVEPAISVRSVTESSRGAGVLIWIPGYISNGKTIVVTPPAAPQEAPQ